MRCTRCQQENPQRAKYCLNCGVALSLACAACGTELPQESKFCIECGQSVAEKAPSPPTSPKTYTPKHLADKILGSRAALEGERKVITVLFADIKGSMELLEGRDPEEARSVIDPVLQLMMDAVHRYDGTVNQALGDGIMALFGAPVAHEDHAVRACYAALALQASIRRYGEELLRTQGIKLQVRVGLNSGEVVVRAIGNDLHMDYTAIGQTTHLAARMEQNATPGSILLTLNTLQLAEGFVRAVSLGKKPVKGLIEPIEIFELTGAGAARSRLQVSAAQGLTRLIGREVELATLRRATGLVRAGHGQVVALVGEAGVGKSRVVWEFAQSAASQSFRTLVSRSVSYGKATAYFPIIEFLKNYFNVEDRDEANDVREKVFARLKALGLGGIIVPMLNLLHVSSEDARWKDLEPSQRAQQTHDAIKQLLIRESQQQSLCVIFEDLHWIDAETQAVLDDLVGSLPTTRILLLVSYRPEYRHEWGRRTYYTQIRLDSLSSVDAEQLLSALLGEHASLGSLKRLLIERTQGIPFFLEESVRALAETHVLEGARGEYWLQRPVETIQVPATVKAILSARIDRLSAEDKRLLQAAAVIGKDVPYALLLAIHEAPEEETIRTGLIRLQEAEFLYESRLFPEVEYTFKHSLTHEVTYASLVHERKRLLHVRVLDAMEKLYQDRRGEHWEVLARHALAGEVWSQAISFSRQAGLTAVKRAALRIAVSWFEQALKTLERLPPSQSSYESAIQLRFDLRTALMPLGEFQRALAVLREAEGLAQAHEDAHHLGLVSGYLSNVFWELGNHEQAVAAGQRALSIALKFDDESLVSMAERYLGRAFFTMGDYTQAVELLRRSAVPSRGRQEASRTAAIPVLSRIFLTMSTAELGCFAEGVQYGQEGIRIAEEFGNPLAISAAYAAIGRLNLRRGHLSEAIMQLERALQLCQSSNIPLLLPVCGAPLALALSLAGQTAQALPLAEEAVRQAESMQRKVEHALWMGFLSEVYLHAGRREEALLHAEQALVLAREYKERGHEAWILRLLGEIHAMGEVVDGDRAAASLRLALTLATELGMRPLEALCHLGLGALQLSAGDKQQARETLLVAAEMLSGMEMTHWLPRVQTMLAETGWAHSAREDA